jgi:hypothetical protein
LEELHQAHEYLKEAQRLVPVSAAATDGHL